MNVEWAASAKSTSFFQSILIPALLFQQLSTPNEKWRPKQQQQPWRSSLQLTICQHPWKITTPPPHRNHCIKSPNVSVIKSPNVSVVPPQHQQEQQPCRSSLQLTICQHPWWIATPLPHRNHCIKSPNVSVIKSPNVSVINSPNVSVVPLLPVVSSNFHRNNRN